MNKLLKAMLKPGWTICRDALPGRLHVIIDHLRTHGELPDLHHPRTFSEKIAWRKLFDRDPRMAAMIDKIAVKEQMSARFGADFVIPTLAVFHSEREIDFTALPYPCVVKASHASGTNLFLHLPPGDEAGARRTLHRWLRYAHHKTSEEWAYSQIRPRLLVEPLLEGGAHGLVDYKFHTFAGKVFAVQVDVDRYSGHRRNFYDPLWRRMPFGLLYPQAAFDVPPPSRLREMLAVAEEIGAAFSFARVDLYEVNGREKFGEITFYPGAGLERFRPRDYDARFGAMWTAGTFAAQEK
jgi:hypothetical protein